MFSLGDDLLKGPGLNRFHNVESQNSNLGFQRGPQTDKQQRPKLGCRVWLILVYLWSPVNSTIFCELFCSCTKIVWSTDRASNIKATCPLWFTFPSPKPWQNEGLIYPRIGLDFRPCFPTSPRTEMPLRLNVPKHSSSQLGVLQQLYNTDSVVPNNQIVPRPHNPA